MLGNDMELHNCILSKSCVIIIMAMTKNFRYFSLKCPMMNSHM